MGGSQLPLSPFDLVDKIEREGHSNTPLSPFDNAIITFYTDRILKKWQDKYKVRFRAIVDNR